MSIEQAKWLVEFYQQVADGGEMQVLYKAHWSLAASGPDLDSLQEHWRVVMPPKVTPVEKLQAEVERLKELYLPDYWSAKRAVKIFSTEYVGQDQAVLWKAIVAEVQALQGGE